MKLPIEYGDNFPVLPGTLWDYRIPWRFPQHEVRLQPAPMLHQVLPWVMLAIGMAIGILWMSWRLPLVQPVHRMETASKIPSQGQGVVGEQPGGDVSSWRVSPKYPMEGMPRRSPVKQKIGLA